MIVEAHRAWGPSSKKVFKFVTKAAAYSTRASSDRAASHLLQNLSVVLQRQNVLTILKHHPPPDLDSPIPEFSPSSVPFSSTISPLLPPYHHLSHPYPHFLKVVVVVVVVVVAVAVTVAVDVIVTVYQKKK